MRCNSVVICIRLHLFSVHTHIHFCFCLQRHTINRAELAAIAVSLKKKISQPDLRILTDSAFSIYTIRNFGTDPASYSYHLHVELLRYIDDIIRARDANGLHTHIGKVKSHIDIHYNEVADEAARSIATGDAEPDVTFSAADPPCGRTPHMAAPQGMQRRRRGRSHQPI